MGLALIEWIVVVVSLGITLGIGMWFSRQGKGSLQEYMLGDRRMDVLPISLSLAATYLSGSAIVSSAQETYLYGMQLGLVVLTYPTVGLFSSFVYLPVIYSIKSASSFEIQHTAMAQYVPAISLSQASGLPAFPIACVLTLICLVYTAAGGLKAVAWADSFQAAIFTSCVICVAFVGTHLVGGLFEVWRKGEEGHRNELFNFDLSPYVRYTFPNIYAGGFILMTQIYLSPSFHQRVVSMQTYRQAYQVSIWSSALAAVFIGFASITGLIVYANFAGCDPVLVQKGIKQYSTILPYFVKQISSKFPGVEGMFLSGVLAAGLSTTTSCWNTVACTMYEDFVVPWLGPNISTKTSFRFLMGFATLFGIISTAFILIIQNVPSLLEATLSMKAFSVSLLFILYNSGMFLPWVNSKGVLAGSLATGIATTYIVLGAQNAKNSKLVKDLPKILTTAKCIVNGTTMEALNMTTTIGTEGYGIVTISDPGVPALFKMSLMLYMVPGAILGLIVSYLVSLMTGGQDLTKVDQNMIVPVMRWALPKQLTSDEDTVVFTDVPLEDLNFVGN